MERKLNETLDQVVSRFLSCSFTRTSSVERVIHHYRAKRVTSICTITNVPCGKVNCPQGKRFLVLDSPSERITGQTTLDETRKQSDTLTER
jgi:hypothetical protein